MMLHHKLIDTLLAAERSKQFTELQQQVRHFIALLRISVRTIENHLRNARNKLGAATTAEAVRISKINKIA